MKIVIASDSFKGNLTSLEVANAMERGIRRVLPKARVIKVPMADGGEGTVQSLVEATGGRVIKKRVRGPLGRAVLARYGILGDQKTAVIEMAEASGLPLVPHPRRNPLKTTTFGTGQLIQDALDKGAKKIIIGIGGSATVDGGTGMAQALGIKFRGPNNRVIPGYCAGGVLETSLDKTTAVIALTYPRNHLAARAYIGLYNGFFWLIRTTFRNYIHDPEQIEAWIADRGFKKVFEDETLLWLTQVYARPLEAA